MTEKRYGLIKDYTSFFKCRRGVIGIFDNRTGYKHIGYKNVRDLLNDLNDEVMDLRAENTKFKFVLSDVVEDLEKQAKSKEPIILSEVYINWIKENVNLNFFSKKGYDGMTEKCKVCKYFRPTDKYCYYFGYDVQYRDDCKRYERRQGRYD